MGTSATGSEKLIKYSTEGPSHGSMTTIMLRSGKMVRLVKEISPGLTMIAMKETVTGPAEGC